MQITGAVLEESGRAAAFRSSRPLSVSSLDLEGPRRGELLVPVEVAGVCHSDLSVVDGARPRPTPMLLGHEAAGIVVDAGDGVDDVAVGDRVVMTFLPRCGDCSGCAARVGGLCVRGARANTAGELMGGGVRLHRGGEPVRHHLGVSAFADHAVVDRRSVVRVEADVPADVAALLGCAVLTGGGAVLNASEIQPGDTTIVVGLGGVGMAALITAVSLGMGPVYGIDTSPQKLASALALGAEEAFLVSDEALKELRGAVVVEAAGNARAFELAISVTAPGGTTVTVGLPARDDLAAVSPLDLVSNSRRIVGSYLGSASPERDIPIFAERWRQGRLPVESLVSANTTLEEINEAMDELASGNALRQLIRFT